MTARASHRDLWRYAQEGKPVQGYGSMSGETGPGYYRGYLPQSLQELMDARRATIDYVVYSYGTPIAWRDAGVWVQPAVSYSVSTAKQQGMLYRLRPVFIPRDCSLEEYTRTLEGLQRFSGWAGSDRLGRWTPGPNWTPGA